MIGLGHDLQAIGELETVTGLREPGVFFTPAELRAFATARDQTQSMAAGFAAKEALFKALPPVPGTWFWADAELVHDRHGAPTFRVGGELAAHLTRRRLRVDVSVSHSGGFASSVVVVSGGRGYLAPVLDPIRRGLRRALRRDPAHRAGAPQ